jgi:transcriptional regulator with XRE-family HTH domain
MEDITLTENRIWKYRKIKGLKQEDLAFLIGQNNSSQISRYERGVAIPKLKYLIKLCSALEINIEYLYPYLIEKWNREVKNEKGKIRKS